jgi:hypothetical protein
LYRHAFVPVASLRLAGLSTVDVHPDARNPGGLKPRGVESLSLDPSTAAVTDFSSTVFTYDRELAPN